MTAYTYIYRDVYIYTCTHTIYIYTYTCTYTYIYIYICIYIYIQICTDTIFRLLCVSIQLVSCKSGQTLDNKSYHGKVKQLSTKMVGQPPMSHAHACVVRRLVAQGAWADLPIKLL